MSEQCLILNQYRSFYSVTSQAFFSLCHSTAIKKWSEINWFIKDFIFFFRFYHILTWYSILLQFYILIILLQHKIKLILINLIYKGRKIFNYKQDTYKFFEGLKISLNGS